MSDRKPQKISILKKNNLILRQFHNKATFNKLKEAANKQGAEYFGVSWLKNKKYVVLYRGKYIHFGHPSYSDFLSHKDKARRDRYLARAKKIRDGNNKLTVNNPNSPNYWAVRLLWM